MPEQLLTILRLCLLAFVYLFFFRVLRAVWVQLKEPALAGGGSVAAAPVRTEATDERRLRVVAPPELVGVSFPVVDELTVGRAAGCGITLDDTFVSQIHARVYRRDGKVFVEDLGSTNGTLLNGADVGSSVLMHRGDRITFGSTVLELS